MCVRQLCKAGVLTAILWNHRNSRRCSRLNVVPGWARTSSWFTDQNINHFSTTLDFSKMCAMTPKMMVCYYNVTFRCHCNFQHIGNIFIFKVRKCNKTFWKKPFLLNCQLWGLKLKDGFFIYIYLCICRLSSCSRFKINSVHLYTIKEQEISAARTFIIWQPFCRGHMLGSALICTWEKTWWLSCVSWMF